MILIVEHWSFNIAKFPEYWIEIFLLLYNVQILHYFVTWLAVRTSRLILQETIATRSLWGKFLEMSERMGVVVLAEDTDILVMLVHHLNKRETVTNEVYLQTKSGLYSIKEICIM